MNWILKKSQFDCLDFNLNIFQIYRWTMQRKVSLQISRSVMSFQQITVVSSNTLTQPVLIGVKLDTFVNINSYGILFGLWSLG